MSIVYRNICIRICLLLAPLSATHSKPQCPAADPVADERAVFFQQRVKVAKGEQLEATSLEENEGLGRWQSSISCVGVARWNQSCKIRNAYVHLTSGNVMLMIKEDTDIPQVNMTLLGVPGGGRVEVRIERYPSDERIVQAASSLRPSRVDGLALYVSFLWAEHWGHGLFDGFWPGYVALAKFGKHKEHFHVLAQDSELRGCSLPEYESHSMSCSLRHTLGRFARNNATQQTRWIGVPQPVAEWALMEELVLGSQGGGEYTSVGGLPGSLGSLEPLSALPAGTDLVKEFANRMYRTHGIPEMFNKKSSIEGTAGRKLRVLITENKRYTGQDVSSMKKYIETQHGSNKLDAWMQASEGVIDESAEAKAQAVAMLNQRPDIEAYYVDWSTYFPLARQLRVIRDADIHMTATGTAQFFGVFLQDGAVNINLGDMHNGSQGTCPTWGEEFLSSSNPRTRAIYRNVSSLASGPMQAREVMDLVDQAAAMIRSGFPIPLHKPEENLSPVGQVLYQVVSKDESSLQAARGYTAADAGYNCHCRPGFSQMDPAPLVFGIANASHCPNFNTDLLLKIRKAQLGPAFDPYIVGPRL